MISQTISDGIVFIEGILWVSISFVGLMLDITDGAVL